MDNSSTDNLYYRIPEAFVPYINNAFERLANSGFRSRFRISEKDREYYFKTRRDIISKHADEFIRNRLSQAYPQNDGKQTPMRGHPVFTAQHATATCCRSCLFKWYGIPKGRELTEIEIDYCVSLIITWLERNVE